MNRRDLAPSFARGDTKGKAGNIFIGGRTIYSYGQLFPIANKISSTEYLFNCLHHSSSTATHQSTVRRALEARGFTVWEMPNLETGSLAPYPLNRVISLQNKILKARKPHIYTKEMDAIHAYWKKCKKRFNLEDEKLDYELSVKSKNAILTKIFTSKLDECLNIGSAA